ASGAFRGGDGSTYAGVLVVLLAAFGVAQSFRRNSVVLAPAQRKLVWFWCAVLVIALLLMFGRFAPFYKIFYSLPYASLIRNSAKFLHIVEWVLLILFAYGAEALCRVGFTNVANASSGKSFWANVTGFNRKWMVGSVFALMVVAVAWLVYTSARSRLAGH